MIRCKLVVDGVNGTTKHLTRLCPDKRERSFYDTVGERWLGCRNVLIEWGEQVRRNGLRDRIEGLNEEEYDYGDQAGRQGYKFIRRS